MNVDTFFLRPYWLLMLIPLVALIALSARRLPVSTRSAWHKFVDPHLLRQLTVKAEDGVPSKWPLGALTVGLIATILALAGPAWERNELPVFKPRDPTVLVLSLAQSMNATDLSPDRLTHAVHKVRDILVKAKGGDVGLVIYSDQPFVAAPLTSDTRVITQMLPELSTSLMPVLGNRLDLAINKAKDVLQRAGARKGHIVVIADDAGMSSAISIASARAAKEADYQVSVLGVGTIEGAALQTASGVPIKTRSGAQAVTRLDETALSRVAEAGGGMFITLSPGTADIDALAREIGDGSPATERANSQFHADEWKDIGYWLLIIPVLLAPLAFRRNVLMALPVGLVVALSSPMPDASATTWDDLWQTRDQQGASVYRKGDFSVAAAEFDNPHWKASALYKAGRYGEAVELYANAATTDDYYNLGNSFAKAGELEKAIAAYDTALKQEPADGDARYNRDLVAKLLEAKKRKEQQENEKQSGGGKQDQAEGSRNEGQAEDGGKQDEAKRAAAENSPRPTSTKANSGDPTRGESRGEQQSDSADNPPQDGQADAQSEPLQPNDGGKSAFRKAMDALLEGNGNRQQDAKEPRPGQSPTAGGLSEIDQAREQQLRAVPDDPSRLLRARIRQHYARLPSNR